MQTATVRDIRAGWLRLLPLAAAAALAAGCSSGPKPPKAQKIVQVPPESTLNANIVEMSFAQQIREGAVVGRTIYPHHFVPDCGELNLIGERQLEALLPTCFSGPLDVNVMRGDVSDQLYAARLDAVRARFIAAGVATDRIAFADKMPGGEGMSSERVLRLAAQEQKRSDSSNRSDSSSGRDQRASGTGNSSGMSGGGSGGGSSGGGSYQR
jgi:uncharacterized membrane protein YgcG